MGGFPSWSCIPASGSGCRLTTGGWGGFLDSSGEAGSSGVVMALRSITFLVFSTSVRVIQGGKFVRRWAVLLGMTPLAVQVGASHRITNTVDVDVGG